MSNNPDQIRAEVEQTRSGLSRNVNALGAAVSPGNVARRQVSKVGTVGADIKDRVMGSAEDIRDTVTDSASGMQDRTGDVTQARRRTQGNPLAAGLIALGAGWLLGSLLPASEREKELAGAAKDEAQPLLSEAQSVVQESAQNLQQPAQEAAQSVKDSMLDAVDHVTTQGQLAREDVQSSAADARDTVRQQAQTP